MFILHPRPQGMNAYRDWQLTPNFVLWVDFFFVCRHVSIWGFQNRVYLSVCLFARLSVPRVSVPREITQASSISVLHSNNWYINGKVFTSTTALKPINSNSFSKKFVIEFWLVFWLVLKSWITLASSISVLHWYLMHQWKGLHQYYNMKTQKFEFHLKKNRNWILTCILTSSWRAEMTLVLNISHTLVIDTSMERSSRVVYHEKSKIWFHYKKNTLLSVSADMFCKQQLAQKTMKKGQQLYSIFTNRLDSIINICLKANHKQKASLRYDSSFTNSHWIWYNILNNINNYIILYMLLFWFTVALQSKYQ